jgi:hypothetical protein
LPAQFFYGQVRINKSKKRKDAEFVVEYLMQNILTCLQDQLALSLAALNKYL